jgi:glycosyltransferase involved in cell wall biosynthesis
MGVAKAGKSSGSPTRVLMISAAGELGGAERSFMELIRALNPLRLHVQACVPAGSLSRELKSSDITVHEIPLERFRRTLAPLELLRQLRALSTSSRAIKEICLKENISLLHANTTHAAIVAWQVSRLSKIPFVWHCRDIVPMRSVNRALGRRAAAVVAISSAVESHLLDQGLPADATVRIANGIDLARFENLNKASARRRVRAELNISEDAPVILSVGALVPWKRHQDDFEVLANVRKKMPNAMCLLAGSDIFGQNKDYIQKLASRAEKLGLGPLNLKMLGERKDVPELLAAADVLISTSENEPFGRVLAEAGAAGVPVVATNSGAKAEIVSDGQTGLLAKSGDIGGLTKACIRLLQDAGLRRKMGEQARARVAELFDIRRTAQEVTTLFEKVESGRSVR